MCQYNAVRLIIIFSFFMNIFVHNEFGIFKHVLYYGAPRCFKDSIKKMAINKCVKLFLILVLVGVVAFGVTFLPFNLSDKFKAALNKVSNHLRGLGGSDSDGKVHLDFSKRDSYTHGSLNIVLDKLDNVPKEGYLKFLHKGEKDAPLDVEKFTLGDTNLEGLEPGLLDYAAGYFKGEDTHLLLVELCLHNKGDGNVEGENNNAEGNNTEKGAQGTNDTNATNGGNGTNAAKGDKTVEKTEGEKVFYAPGENNKWVKLPPEADLGAKVDEVFATLTANTPPENQQGTTPPAAPAGTATPSPALPNPELPPGETPVPPPQNYPLTGPKAPQAGAQLPVPNVPGTQQPEGLGAAAPEPEVHVQAVPQPGQAGLPAGAGAVAGQPGNDGATGLELGSNVLNGGKEDGDLAKVVGGGSLTRENAVESAPERDQKTVGNGPEPAKSSARPPGKVSGQSPELRAVLVSPQPEAHNSNPSLKPETPPSNPSKSTNQTVKVNTEAEGGNLNQGKGQNNQQGSSGSNGQGGGNGVTHNTGG
ncbi:putative integral membrane protein [Theileria parva strain Muguga]|uniref:Uncharacterized protein n=1 Tax=Theileria parva TaxID=5875 RepID=Q4N753_THEPA|nr:putative integral membrane protein [Theileria parva strain Muguga]EAN34205.1 putative integral membrane protein [Theileria parva strain Muguga]|eukprot:XP_766488.1 hypothetical protein [Theileria parva strain Muguga]